MKGKYYLSVLPDMSLDYITWIDNPTVVTVN